MNVVAPLAIGLVFGWVLQRTGLSRYERIAGVFRFRDLAVLQVLLTAIVVGALGVVALQSLGLGSAVPIPSTLLGATLIGGAVFGLGMSLSGFCPGTIAAGAGEGRLDYWIPGSLGIYAGSVGYGLLWPRLAPWLRETGDLGPATLAGLLGVDPWLVAILFAEVALLAFYLMARRTPTASPGVTP